MLHLTLIVVLIIIIINHFAFMSRIFDDVIQKLYNFAMKQPLNTTHHVFSLTSAGLKRGKVFKNDPIIILD